VTPADEAHFIQLWNAGMETAAIAQALGIPRGTVSSRASTLAKQGKIQPRPKGGAYPRQQAQMSALTEEASPDQTGHTGAHHGTPPAHPTSAHRGTPAVSRRRTRGYQSTPQAQSTEAHPGTPRLLVQQPTRGHLSIPEVQSTTAHPSVLMPQDLAVRLLSLLPDLEVLVARERDRQQLLRTPVGTPQHTVKKTYVVEVLYVDLIERYAQAEGVERKDVVNLAFHEFFERRQYLPQEAP
jgi:hypothetical protein